MFRLSTWVLDEVSRGFGRSGADRLILASMVAPLPSSRVRVAYLGLISLIATTTPTRCMYRIG